MTPPPEALARPPSPNTILQYVVYDQRISNWENIITAPPPSPRAASVNSKQTASRTIRTGNLVVCSTYHTTVLDYEYERTECSCICKYLHLRTSLPKTHEGLKHEEHRARRGLSLACFVAQLCAPCTNDSYRPRYMRTQPSVRHHAIRGDNSAIIVLWFGHLLLHECLDYLRLRVLIK